MVRPLSGHQEQGRRFTMRGPRLLKKGSLACDAQTEGIDTEMGKKKG